VGFAAVALSVARLRKITDDRAIPFMAILAAGIFVAQMINFPVFGGTSGHLLGAALATVLLGPFAGIVVMTVILIIQCLVFTDGGLLALGLNVFNMAVVGCLVSWVVYRPISRKSEKAAVIAAAWTSVFFAAFLAALELVVSYDTSGGAYGISTLIAVPSMLGYHALIGIGEAAITAGIFIFLSKVAPETLKMRIGTKEAVT
ncbi:MAG: energy-coupling factor ABC transporter permease, partial [Methanomassiliicoccales archaeon]|nr:energy-coupling factor ABC transporter permease [Methanomassiliicoccales archaeon]